MKRLLLWIEPFLRSLYARYHIPLVNAPITVFPDDYEQLREDNAALRSQIADMKSHPQIEYKYLMPPTSNARGAHGQRTYGFVRGGY